MYTGEGLQRRVVCRDGLNLEKRNERESQGISSTHFQASLVLAEIIL